MCASLTLSLIAFTLSITPSSFASISSLLAHPSRSLVTPANPPNVVSVMRWWTRILRLRSS